jgi:signal transduction histidine kinase
VKWRVAAALVALTALVLLVQDIPLAAYLRAVESNRINTELQRDAFVIAGRSVQVLQSQTAQTNPALSVLVTAYAKAEGAQVAVVDAAGTVVASSDPEIARGTSLQDRGEIQAALRDETASGEQRAKDGDTSRQYVAVPVLSGPQTLGAVRLSYPTAELQSRVNDRVRGIGIVAGLTLLAAIAVAFLLAGTITRPLKRLQETTAQLARGDLTARAETDSGAPELRKLSRDLNTMANRLASLIEAQRSFAGDASHQLRTPLTALRLRLDQAAEALLDDPAAASEPVDDARAETERLQHVIDGLLRLARAEGQQQELCAIDLTAIAHERFAVWQPLAEEQGVRLELSAPALAMIQAVRAAPEQILDNYLDNALSVSPYGSTVLVTIVESSLATKPTTTLLISDSGPGLSADQRTRAFDRFWSIRQDNAGTGLGLAIVRQLADASQATVELRESVSGGIEAVAVFRRT